MNHAVLLTLCFLPLAIVFVVMKLALWLTETTKEVDYVAHEPERIRGPYVENAYGDLDEEEEWNGN